MKVHTPCCGSLTRPLIIDRGGKIVFLEFFRTPMNCLACLSFMFATSITAVRADDEYVWSHGNNGKDKKSVYFGVPESGSQWLIASCEDSDRLSLSLFIEKNYVDRILKVGDLRILTVMVGNAHFPLTGEISEDEGNDGFMFTSSLGIDGNMVKEISSDKKAIFRYGNVGVHLSGDSSAFFKRMNKSCAHKSKAADEQSRALVRMWSEQNSKCKGSYHSPSTRKSCDAREQTSARLYRIGWCYGKTTDTAQYDANWHQCGRDSIRK